MSSTLSFIWKRLHSIWTIPDLRKKLLFTLGMLLVFRVLAHITVPLTHQEQVNRPIFLRAARAKTWVNCSVSWMYSPADPGAPIGYGG
jgi:preprotein translocase subunit SecY